MKNTIEDAYQKNHFDNNLDFILIPLSSAL